ncbi:MAG: NAD(P)H-dependent glycerol-3-phosphate dehydrogenase [Spirochaetota bacterium]
MVIDFCVLGAGYMGGAITFPISENGAGVRLWGTWLDDEIISSCASGKHPRLNKRLDHNVRVYYSDQLEEALEGADVVIMGVSSEGFIPVMERFLDCLRRVHKETDVILLTLTKGFVVHERRIRRISETGMEMFNQACPGKQLIWASVGGPVKATELSDHIPTATVFGMSHTLLRKKLKWFFTDYYRVAGSEDITGVEVSSALKNVYAVGIGISDGMYKSSGRLCHNFKSMIFTQAVTEMALIVDMAGGSPDTVYGLAGVGDLYVTASSGRNGLYGKYVGSGCDPLQAYNKMISEDKIAEGYHTLKLGAEYIQGLDKQLWEKLPLYRSIYNIIFNGRAPEQEMKSFASNYGA